MSLPSKQNGPPSESLKLGIHFEINDQLHNAFSVRYSNAPLDNIINDISNVSIACLNSSQAFESWQGVEPSQNSIDQWRIYQNQQYILASVPTWSLQHLNMDQASEKAYSMIFQQLEIWGYPYLIRTWNYFSRITHNDYSAQNNYQLFCSGRSRAYNQYQIAEQAYPAATVIGTNQTALHVHFIAAKNKGIGIENSKQVSAFEYPINYSEDPPLFSRALLHRNHNQQILFISGTASITGHNTQYEGDINRQTEVCLDNIQHLLDTAIQEHQFTAITLRDFVQLKIYIKHADHLDTVKTHLHSQLGMCTPIFYFQGDMCRSDLLVEIEALAITPHA